MQMTRAQREAIVKHAEEDAPNECCGYISARDGVVQEVFKAENIRHSPYAFDFGFKDLQAANELGWTTTVGKPGSSYTCRMRSAHVGYIKESSSIMNRMSDEASSTP